jgi:hypothetical protein
MVCRNPMLIAQNKDKVYCAIAIDSGNDCLVEAFRVIFATQVQPDSLLVAAFDDLIGVVRMVRNTMPELLIIHSNLLLMGPGLEAIAGCAAVSPTTRYLIATGWDNAAISELSDTLAPFKISVDVLRMPLSPQDVAVAIARDRGHTPT